MVRSGTATKRGPEGGSDGKLGNGDADLGSKLTTVNRTSGLLPSWNLDFAWLRARKEGEGVYKGGSRIINRLTKLARDRKGQYGA